MVQLKREVTEKYVFVKNGVIFKILKNNGGDECAVKLTSKNVPHITVNDQELYLDSLIEVGDVYSEESGFKKSVHCQGDEETEMTFQDYYYSLCEKNLSSMIASQAPYCNTAYEFKTYLKKVIDLTEEKYRQLKKDEVKKRILEAAKDVAHQYGYEVTTESIDIVETLKE